MPVEPDTEIVQGDPSRQPGLKTVQLVRTLPVQREGMVELVEDGLHDLAYPGQPAAHCFGPGIPAVAPGRTDYPGSVAVSPPLSRPPGPQSLCPLHTSLGLVPPKWATWDGGMPEGTEILGQGLVLGAGCGKAETGNAALGIDGKQQVEARIPAQPVAPANIRLTGQPTGAPAFGGPGRDTGTVQCFVDATLSSQQVHQVAGESRQGLVMVLGQPVELAPAGQYRESWPPAAGGITVEVPFTAKARPLAEDNQGNHLALRNYLKTPTLASFPWMGED